MEPIRFINILNPAASEEAFDLSEIQSRIDISSSGSFSHTLVTVGHQRLDPWVLSQYAMNQNAGFSPLIAVNPAYHHPVEVAQKFLSLAAFYPNRVAMNLVTGSFFKEMNSVNEKLDLEAKKKRLVEFHDIVVKLVNEGGLNSFDGEFYKFQGLKIHQPVQKPLKVFVSGHFVSSLKSENTFYVKNIKPLSELESAATPRSAVSLGICTRKSDEEAEKALEEHWPESRQGELMFKLSLNNSNTPWNVWVKKYLENNPVNKPDFSLGPLMRFQSSSPFLVGSYDRVTETLQKIIEKGYSTFLIDFKNSDLEHVETVLEKIRRQNG